MQRARVTRNAYMSDKKNKQQGAAVEFPSLLGLHAVRKSKVKFYDIFSQYLLLQWFRPIRRRLHIGRIVAVQFFLLNN